MLAVRAHQWLLHKRLTKKQALAIVLLPFRPQIRPLIRPGRYMPIKAQDSMIVVPSSPQFPLHLQEDTSDFITDELKLCN